MKIEFEHMGLEINFESQPDDELLGITSGDMAARLMEIAASIGSADSAPADHYATGDVEVVQPQLEYDDDDDDDDDDDEPERTSMRRNNDEVLSRFLESDEA